MSRTPEKWYVGYDQEYDIDAGDDGRTIGHPTGRDEFDGTIFTVTGEDQIEIIAEHIRDEKTALRIAALWNMGERLGLSTEEIEANASLIAAAPAMMEALVGAKWAMESYISEQLLEKMDEYQDVVKALRKARGEE